MSAVKTVMIKNLRRPGHLVGIYIYIYIYIYIWEGNIERNLRMKCSGIEL